MKTHQALYPKSRFCANPAVFPVPAAVAEGERQLDETRLQAQDACVVLQNSGGAMAENSSQHDTKSACVVGRSTPESAVNLMGGIGDAAT